MNVLMFANQKGGAGKTTTAQETAYLLSKSNIRWWFSCFNSFALLCYNGNWLVLLPKHIVHPISFAGQRDDCLNVCGFHAAISLSIACKQSIPVQQAPVVFQPFTASVNLPATGLLLVRNMWRCSYGADDLPRTVSLCIFKSNCCCSAKKRRDIVKLLWVVLLCICILRFISFCGEIH